MVVAKGDQTDPDTPSTVRVSAKLLKRFGIQDGAIGSIAAEPDGTRHKVVLRKSGRASPEDTIAVRKKLRDALKLDIGDRVTLWVETAVSGVRRSVSTNGLQGRLLITDTPIVELDVDAIVNAANTQLRSGGGVDGAIHDAAGPELLRACRALKGCKVGRVKMTEGYDLPAKYVFHAVGPQWEGGSHREHQLLASCYRETLSLAKKEGLQTIAFPCISTGVYGFPLEDATIIAFREIISFIESNEAPETVYLCPFTDEEAQAYRGVRELCLAGIPIEQILLVSQARSGSDDDSVELSARGARALSVKRGSEIRLAAGENAGTFRVGVGDAAYPECRCRLNAKARKKLGVEKGEAVHVVL
ncbi:MAG: macro domain-containing protein [Verrucomicrobia bacterium]|nr:macro domain-containing protein [Verrucomicrobiota bacterium]